MNALRDRALLSALMRTYWAVEPGVLGRLADVVLRHADGVKLPAEAIAEIVAARGRDSDSKALPPAYAVGDGLAVVPISGILVKHASLVNGSSQPAGTATEEVSGLLDRAAADSSVRGVLLAIDSPGGSVSGISDLADQIEALSAAKPVWALGEDVIASGAYWLGSRAQRLLVNSTAAVGSIGVYAVVEDSSRLYENRGIRVEVVRAGRLKGAFVEGTPVTDEARASLQGEIDRLYALFVDSVAKGRRMARSAAEALADGGVKIGAEAVAAGLADGVASYRQAVEAMKREISAGRRGGGAPTRGVGNGVPAGSARRDAQSNEGDAAMAKEKTESGAAGAGEPDVITAEQLAQTRREAEASGATAERKRIADLTAALSADWAKPALQAAIDGGLDVAAARNGGYEAACKRIAALESELAAANEKLRLIAAGGVKPIPQTAGDSAPGASAEPKAVERFEAAVAERVQAGASRAAALRSEIEADAEGYKAWLAKANESRRN